MRKANTAMIIKIDGKGNGRIGPFIAGLMYFDSEVMIVRQNTWCHGYGYSLDGGKTFTWCDWLHEVLDVLYPLEISVDMWNKMAEVDMAELEEAENKMYETKAKRKEKAKERRKIKELANTPVSECKAKKTSKVVKVPCW